MRNYSFRIGLNFLKIFKFLKPRLVEQKLKASAGCVESFATNSGPGCCGADTVRGSLGRNEQFWF